VKNARNKERLANNLCAEASKSLAVAEGRNKKLALKLATMDKDWRSAEDGLRNVEVQTKEQHQRLHYTEIELAIA